MNAKNSEFIQVNDRQQATGNRRQATGKEERRGDWGKGRLGEGETKRLRDTKTSRHQDIKTVLNFDFVRQNKSKKKHSDNYKSDKIIDLLLFKY